MKITEIIVSAGRTVNHPYENYSNLKPHLTLKAELSEGEDYEAAVKTLQAKAERMVEDHKNAMLASIEELHDLTEKQREIASLEAGIVSAQQKLDRIRREIPQLALPEAITGEKQ